MLLRNNILFYINGTSRIQFHINIFMYIRYIAFLIWCCLFNSLAPVSYGNYFKKCYLRTQDKHSVPGHFWLSYAKKNATQRHLLQVNIDPSNLVMACCLCRHMASVNSDELRKFPYFLISALERYFKSSWYFMVTDQSITRRTSRLFMLLYGHTDCVRSWILHTHGAHVWIRTVTMWRKYVDHINSPRIDCNMIKMKKAQQNQLSFS